MSVIPYGPDELAAVAYVTSGRHNGGTYDRFDPDACPRLAGQLATISTANMAAYNQTYRENCPSITADQILAALRVTSPAYATPTRAMRTVSGFLYNCIANNGEDHAGAATLDAIARVSSRLLSQLAR